jgi:hypothetical protein
MSKTLKHRLAIAVGTLGVVWGSLAHADPLGNITGTWKILGNQSAGDLILSQGTGTPCAPIRGTIYGTPNSVLGYYCPTTGRIAFTRKNTAGVVIQTWVGTVSDVVAGQPHRMGGTFHPLDVAAGSGPLREVHFQGQK